LDREVDELGGGLLVGEIDSRHGALQQAPADNPEDVHSVAFSPDGKWLAAMGDDGITKLWRLDVRA